MLEQATDPIEIFALWLAEAAQTEVADPNAMALATVDAMGAPQVRMVLLKGFDQRGFAFYTNLGSRKAQALRHTPRAALCFHWKSRFRQVRIEGPVESVGGEEADAYFSTRALQSQIGAWASLQSQPLESRTLLEARVADITARFAGNPVPRPEHWSGFRLVPDYFEFWQDGAFRLHDRVTFRRDQDCWAKGRLYP